MFDKLDVKTTLNDLYDNGIQDDDFALIFKLYETSERRGVEREVITQGDFLGPILASSTVDTFGKECYEQQKHLYWYRDKTPVSLLTMLDDVLSISNCGPESIQIKEYVNKKSGSKKLQFAPDKTSRLHIGRKRPEYKCDNSHIDCWKSNRNENSEIYMGGVKVKEAFITKYLGEVISSDGTNTENIAARKKRGF